ncbi:MAG TPA: DUF6599 family protein [Candidatus Acidoferrum sp.]|nr:DUF6599 family protein [Candidatus Acidoferrum sp.]
MRRIFYALILLGLLATLGAPAELALLPDHFGPWLADGPSQLQILSAKSIYEGPAIILEAGFRSIEERNFKNGNEQLGLFLYTFKDPSGAYEFYTSVIAPGMKSAGLGDESAFGEGNNGAILVGNLVVFADKFSSLKPEDLGELLPVLKAKADKTPYPPLKSYLPITWRVFGTERYALGPVGFRAAMSSLGQGAYADLAEKVGFQLGAEAILAKYQAEHGSGVLLLLEYPTPQIAEQHLHHLEEALPTAAKRSGVTVERKASLLSLVFEPTSAMHAQAIRDEVNYETEVTWNEPSHTATDPPMVVIMVKIFFFTGMFLGFATGLGIAFGGLRVIIKRLFPGKVFDRPGDIEVLQLGLSGKKIDASDMY